MFVRLSKVQKGAPVWTGRVETLRGGKPPGASSFPPPDGAEEGSLGGGNRVGHSRWLQRPLEAGGGGASGRFLLGSWSGEPGSVYRRFHLLDLQLKVDEEG